MVSRDPDGARAVKFCPFVPETLHEPATCSTLQEIVAVSCGDTVSGDADIDISASGVGGTGCATVTVLQEEQLFDSLNSEMVPVPKAF